jgi:polysaccharide pyruvyl transferase WcaK-like protein
MIEGNCNELKGYISQYKMLITARTHASIAGYSSCVPTLVLGYSIKSKGIATDLFGTYENYVLPIDELKTENDLTNNFLWLEEHYENIKQHLKEIMPYYKNRCYELRGLYEDLCL